MIERLRNHTRGMILLAAATLGLVVVVWGGFTLMATTGPVVTVIAAAAVLGCGLAWLLVERSRAAHDRAIADTYPSFGPALARRRAEGL
jgi:Flp pilus assembly protein TadB